jgi:hypothetical protein
MIDRFNVRTPALPKKPLVKVVEQEDLFGDSYTFQPVVDRDTLTGCLEAVFKGMSLEQVVAMITNEYVELLEYIELSCGSRSACRKTSLLFNPHRLDTRTQTSAATLYEALSGERENFHSGLARATLMRMKERTKPGEMFYMVAQLGVNGIQYVNEFPPHVARDWCVRYALNQDSVVLDPCAGWGGRMIGCSVVVNEYHCYEPASKTANGLHRLAEFLFRLRGGDFNATVCCQPYEDSSERPQYYDLALTSPPYYDSEIYSDEPTNSLNRYASFDEWVEGFYWPLIDKTMRQLKPSGAFVFNIGDRRYPLTARMTELCEKRGYTLKRLTGDIVDSGGIGRELGMGEKFFELRNS